MTTESKKLPIIEGFTPGPWNLTTVATSCGQCHKIGPFPPRNEGDDDRHACLYADYPSPFSSADRELLANASLIAAAPDLYRLAHEQREALRRLSKASSEMLRVELSQGMGQEDFESAQAELDAAIAAATPFLAN